MDPIIKFAEMSNGESVTQEQIDQILSNIKDIDSEIKIQNGFFDKKAFKDWGLMLLKSPNSENSRFCHQITIDLLQFPSVSNHSANLFGQKSLVSLQKLLNEIGTMNNCCLLQKNTSLTIVIFTEK